MMIHSAGWIDCATTHSIVAARNFSSSRVGVRMQYLTLIGVIATRPREEIYSPVQRGAAARSKPKRNFCIFGIYEEVREEMRFRN